MTMNLNRNVAWTLVLVGTAAGVALSGDASVVRAQPAGAVALPRAVGDQSVTKRVPDAGPDGAVPARDSGTMVPTAASVATDSVVAAPNGGSLATAPTSFRAPPPPPPSDAQVAALGRLKQQVDSYEKGAKDYRDTVTSIIRLHYETKRREVLADLNVEIGIEKTELKKARANAIKRLEDFVATYSGVRSHPESTPDAMYRLAALYEECCPTSRDLALQADHLRVPAVQRAGRRILLSGPCV
jgi:hypothetical protein